MIAKIKSEWMVVFTEPRVLSATAFAAPLCETTEGVRFSGMKVMCNRHLTEELDWRCY